MVVDDQHELLAFLSTPAAYAVARAGRPTPSAVERIDTHSAAVFLVGDDAYKLKRAVRYDYLDFSTLERRRQFCEAEVALNRRTAPHVYLGVVPVTREASGRLAVGGVGVPIEWLVHMRRFPDDQLLDRLATRGALPQALMPPLAQSIARLHTTAARCTGRSGRGAMRWVVEGNELGLRDEGAGRLDADRCERVVARTRQELDVQASRLDARAEAGWIRVCHGDLHLGNIVLLDGEPVLFDAVEFNDDMSCIDVLYDVAFLLMDLWRRDLSRHANELLNHYVRSTFDAAQCDALALLPLFLSCRSAVRAKTSVTASRLQPDEAHAAHLVAEARAYLLEAEQTLAPSTPVLVAIGGHSGSGKSTVSRAVAADVGRVPGALHLRSDMLRKRLAGVDETARLPAEAYTPDAHERVYAEVFRWAQAALAAGHSVIADAVFAKEDERRAIEATALAAGARFAGVWLEAPFDVLMHRVERRVGDASDATAAVVAGQLARGADAVQWAVVQAVGSADEVEQRVRAALRQVL